MQEKLPEALLPLLRLLAHSAQEHSLALYVIGGFVRDRLLDLPLTTPDLDLVVVGDAVTLVRSLAQRHGGTLTAHPQFGTATWHLPDGSPLPSLDFATTRLEYYAEPAALPSVTLIDGQDALLRDARRRDFSINTLAIQLAPEPFGALVDPLNALPDLRAKVLRILHPRSFQDDPTRILRAARFVARLGFELEPESAAQLPAALPYIAALSGERLRHEFDLIFEELKPHLALRWLSERGVLQAVHPRLTFDERLANIYANLPALRLPDDVDPLVLRWAIFGGTFPESPALLARLALPKATHRALSEVHGARLALAALAAEALPSQIAQALAPFCPEAILAAALLGSRLDRKRALRYLFKMRHIKPSVDGNFLRELGLKPGPLFGKLLNRLRDAVLDGAAPTAEAQHALLKSWIEELQKN
ncbi:MAG: CCA tRNA nucleotidyltransferase [Chloroflexota bacterium]|nr:MAG: CCA tRNA nucleotidyltransferase [Chloroflexota bacterium]